MRKTLLFLFVGLILILGFASCTKVHQARWTYLDQTKLTTLEAVPLEYGQLKAVTVMQDNPEWSEMWFQDDSGTIRIVPVNWFTNQTVKEPLVIPRVQALSGGK